FPQPTIIPWRTLSVRPFRVRFDALRYLCPVLSFGTGYALGSIAQTTNPCPKTPFPVRVRTIERRYGSPEGLKLTRTEHTKAKWTRRSRQQQIAINSESNTKSCV